MDKDKTRISVSIYPFFKEKFNVYCAEQNKSMSRYVEDQIVFLLMLEGRVTPEKVKEYYDEKPIEAIRIKIKGGDKE